MTTPTRLHLANVAIENVKGIRGCNVEIRDGALVEVLGGNGDGKSSFIDGIWYALVGTQPLAGGRKLPAGHSPVTVGEDRGQVELRLAGHPAYTVTRKWTPSGSTVTVVNTETGRAEREPVALLKSLCGELAVDPLRFMSETESKQVATLAKALRLELVLDGDLVELAAFDAAIEVAMAERTVLAGEVEKLQTMVDSTPAPPPDLPTEPVATDDLLAEAREAAESNRERARLHEQVGAATTRVSGARERLDRLRAEVTEAEGALVAARDAQREAQAAADAAPAEIDEDAIRERLAKVADTNSLIESGRRRSAQLDDLRERRQKHNDLVATISELRERKKTTLAETAMPYPGLSIDPDGRGLTLNGVPLKDCSAAEQRLVACGLAMDPEAVVRLIRVEDGSLLDVDFLADLAKMAEERDYQVLIEIVDPDGDRGIVFSEGRVVSAYGEPT